ncbi:MAG: methyltransferase domain-containing protein [Oscillospiraceae bacterium]|nr:methyltransferase domain-containing protein [Oscillospiraceae bacterium]
MELICPICGEPLARQEKRLACPRGHSFDIARQGYVHLLPVQQKRSLHPGDTREQVLSRRAFLESGAYLPIVEAVREAAKAHYTGGEVLDVGCGEGWYAVQVAEALKAPLTGLDISKEAVRCAAAKYKHARWICGTAAHLPVTDGSVGLLMSMFALTVPEEFRRVLKEDGIFLQVLAAQDHLMGLKSIIYPEILLKEKDSVPKIEGFALAESIPVRFDFTAQGEQIGNLLSMTPHFWRISAEGAKRLEETKVLRDTASCVVNVYQRA